MENYYKVLGLDDYCSDQTAIKKAYREKIKYYHPDSGNVEQSVAEEKTKQINVAYDTLSDPSKKQAYDDQLKYQGMGYSSTNNYYSNNTYSGYSNPNTNYNSNYQDPFSGFGFTPFGFYRTYTVHPGQRNRVPFFLRLIITIVIINFLFNACGALFYGGYGYDDSYYYGYSNPYQYSENRPS